MLLYSTVIFLGAFLLFAVQPLCARALLPLFGGSAAVWTTCLLFFQSALLLGYLQAFVTRRLGQRTRALLHALLLGLSTALLPIAIRFPKESAIASPYSTNARPALHLLWLLAKSIGLPYVLLAATGPLAQDWFAQRHPTRNPYRLYALSNLASLLSLCSYPVLFEPTLTIPQQARFWSYGYALFVVLGAALALKVRGTSFPTVVTPFPNPQAASASQSWPAPRWHSYALWILLPACATTLLLSTTTHITEDVAAIPLLWILPLSLYLLSFVFCFARRTLYHRRLFRPLLALALPTMAWLLLGPSKTSLIASLALFCLGLFIACVCLHGELARLQPPPELLTTYYLLLALGGALGGLFVGLLAPLLFSTHVELQIGLFACATLALLSALATPQAERSALDPDFEDRPWRAITSFAWVIALGIALVIGTGRNLEDARLSVRNFYGSLRVVDTGAPKSESAVRKLLHGSINHGAQWLSPLKRTQPCTYYCADSGVALAFAHHHEDRPRSLGVIGLGAGSLALYAKENDHLRFYELNPLVEQIARTQFDYLPSSRAAIDIAPGDARLSLEDEDSNAFDILVLDAFSGDAIPVHLLTREAFALYFSHLAKDGVLAIHISNKHIDLEPVIADAAAAAGRPARLVTSDDDDPRYCFHTRWAIIAATPTLFDDPAFEDSVPLTQKPGFRPFTDDYSNLLPLLR